MQDYDSAYSSLPDSFVIRLNGTGFINRKEEIMYVEYGTISNFKDFKKEAAKTIKINYHSSLRIYDREGVEVFEDDLPMLNKKDVLYHAPKGEDFDYTSILADYDRKDILGEGGFGKVYLAISRETGNNVAIKFMNISHYLTHADQVEEIYREADAMEKLDHNHIIKLYKAFLHKKEVILIMEYAGDRKSVV